MQRQLIAIQTGWNSLPPAVRALAALAILALAGGAVWMSRQPPVNPVVDLLETRLDDAAMQRMRLVLVQNGVEGFRFEGQRLLVPRERQADCLKFLAEADAIPASLALGDGPGVPGANLFLPRSQQELLQQQFHERKLRQLLMGLPFVADARVQIDSRPAGSVFEAPDLRCVASIRAQGKLVLDHDQLLAIENNIGTALAGIRPERIVINDLNAGMTWNHETLCRPGQVERQIGSLRMIRQLEHCLEQGLREWPGVTWQIVAARPSLAAPPAAPGAMRNPAQDERTDESLAAGANAPVRVPSQLPRQVSGELVGASPAAGPTREPAGSPDAFEALFAGSLPVPSIRLIVGPEALRSYLGRSGSPGGPMTTGTPAEDLARTDGALQEALRDELVRAARAGLASARISTAELPSIEVEFPAPGPAVDLRNGTSPGQSLWGDGSRGIMLATIAGAGLCGLLMLSTTRRPRRPASVPDTADSPDVWFDPTVGHPRQEQIRREIDSLIERNPDVAARVIQNWIRDAA